MKVPDGIEPIIGWRYWTLDSMGFLNSIVKSERWLPHRHLEAECARSDGPVLYIHHTVITSDTSTTTVSDGLRSVAEHDAPEESCRCGIYAARDLDSLRGAVGRQVFNMVVGTVKLWGKVVPAEFGYRAQFAYPDALYVVQDTFAEPFDLAELEFYGVPVGEMARKDAEPKSIAAGLGFSVHMFAVPAAQVMKQFEEAQQTLAEVMKPTADALARLSALATTPPEPPPSPIKNWMKLNRRGKRAGWR